MRSQFGWKIPITTAIFFGFGEFLCLIIFVFFLNSDLIGFTHWSISPVYVIASFLRYDKPGFLQPHRLCYRIIAFKWSCKIGREDSLSDS